MNKTIKCDKWVDKITFEDCGLDIDKNILQAPMCDCGCGNYMDICAEDNKEIAEIMNCLLSLQECNYCAIYTLLQDNCVIIGTNIDGEVKSYVFRYEDESIPGTEFIKEWQEECNYHCYGLMIQRADKKSYRIVMK